MIDSGSRIAGCRIVDVEEHVNLPELTGRLSEKAMVDRGYLSGDLPFGRHSMLEEMNDTEGRLERLNAAGVTVQVLSYPLAGAALLQAREAASCAKDANDAISRRITEHPDRYAAFAHLPLTDPNASADELERAVKDLGFKGALVNGATNGRYLDDSSFEPLLVRAQALDVPIYLHPAPSPKPARDSLYGSLPGDLGFWLSVSGWGWHVDTAVHVLRLMLSGVFERHPKSW